MVKRFLVNDCKFNSIPHHTSNKNGAKQRQRKLVQNFHEGAGKLIRACLALLSNFLNRSVLSWECLSNIVEKDWNIGYRINVKSSGLGSVGKLHATSWVLNADTWGCDNFTSSICYKWNSSFLKIFRKIWDMEIHRYLYTCRGKLTFEWHIISYIMVFK